MRGTIQHAAVVVVAILLAMTLLASPFAGVALAQNETASTTPTPTSETATSDGGDGVVDVGSGAESDSGNDTSGPSMADGLRLNPIAFDEDYARIETIESDTRYNVTGKYAVFASNIDVKTARVTQPGSEARVMDGQRTIEVTFTDDAAPSSATYYEIELFFQDDSKYVVEVFVQNTDLMVSTVDMRDAHEFVERIKRDAEESESGYNVEERGIAAAEDYYEDKKEMADLLSNIFGPTIEKFQLWAIATVSSALAIILICALLIFFLRRVKSAHGQKLEALVNTPNLQDIKRQAMTYARLEDRQQAAEHPLHEVSEIGRDHVYWIDAADVHNVKQLADLFHFGQVRFEDGEIVRDEDDAPVMEHTGLDALIEADRLRDTWIEPVVRDGMLSEQDAIAHGKAALDLMASKYNEPAYRESRLKVRELLDDLSEGRSYSFGTGTTGMGGISTGSTGADD